MAPWRRQGPPGQECWVILSILSENQSRCTNHDTNISANLWALLYAGPPPTCCCEGGTPADANEKGSQGHWAFSQDLGFSNSGHKHLWGVVTEGQGPLLLRLSAPGFLICHEQSLLCLFYLTSFNSLFCIEEICAHCSELLQEIQQKWIVLKYQTQ